MNVFGSSKMDKHIADQLKEPLDGIRAAQQSQAGDFRELKGTVDVMAKILLPQALPQQLKKQAALDQQEFGKSVRETAQLADVAAAYGVSIPSETVDQLSARMTNAPEEEVPFLLAAHGTHSTQHRSGQQQGDGEATDVGAADAHLYLASHLLLSSTQSILAGSHIQDRKLPGVDIEQGAARVGTMDSAQQFKSHGFGRQITLHLAADFEYGRLLPLSERERAQQHHKHD